MAIVATSGEPDAGRPGLDWLICFAVVEEAAFHIRPWPPQCKRLITGMGRRNASNAIHDTLKQWRPRRVITAGFAGGLNPELKRGTVVFDEDSGFGLEPRLMELGAAPAKFHCAQRVAITTAEKMTVRRETGADVVEMESSVIRTICRAAGVPSATIRVISDAAGDDLPLDFNALMTPSDRINWWKFGRTLILRPMLIGRLIEFQRQAREAAKELARVLDAVVRG